MDGAVTWAQIGWAVSALAGFFGVAGAFFSVKWGLEDVRRRLKEHVDSYAIDYVSVRTDLDSLRAWRERERGAASVRDKRGGDLTQTLTDTTEYHKRRR